MAPLSESVDMLSSPSSPDTTDMEAQNTNVAGSAHQSTGGKTRRRRTFKELSRNFVCELCSRPYASMHALKQHKRLKHASSDDSNHVTSFTAGAPLSIRLSDGNALPYGSRARAHSTPEVPSHAISTPSTPAFLSASGSNRAPSLDACSFPTMSSPTAHAPCGSNCDSSYPCTPFSSYETHKRCTHVSPAADVEEHFARALSARRTMSAPLINTSRSFGEQFSSPLALATQYASHSSLMSAMLTPDAMYDGGMFGGDNGHCDVVLEEDWAAEDISALASNLDSFMASVEGVQTQELLNQLLYGSTDLGIPV
eukprot:comp8438_c0_seq1/m.3789 comp8438_c0_seq1/g.3789  ORF comp8438_c0_seq1/g.3789 comp8438_c0_seq1/m.3789 type:complete len:311 (-) comp8438_c0_seq1:483-1415(-)